MSQALQCLRIDAVAGRLGVVVARPVAMDQLFMAMAGEKEIAVAAVLETHEQSRADFDGVIQEEYAE